MTGSPERRGLLRPQELTGLQLRSLVRTHVFWLVVGSGLLITGKLLPWNGWMSTSLSLLLMAAGAVLGGLRLMQLNAIQAELRERERVRQAAAARAEALTLGATVGDGPASAPGSAGVGGPGDGMRRSANGRGGFATNGAQH